MLSVYICEDSAKQREMIEHSVKNWIMIQEYDMSLIASEANPRKLYSLIETKKTLGIYFLDIDLGATEMNGFELAKKIRQVDPEGFIIFITTHDELAFQTFQYQVEPFDYILKDERQFMKEKIQNCLDNINDRIQKRQIRNELFPIYTNKKIVYVNLAEVSYFEAIDNHKIVYIEDQRIIRFSGTLKKLEKELPKTFLKSHKSFLVNKNQIDYIDKELAIIYFKNGTNCLIAKRKMKDFF